MTTANASGIEWLTATNSKVKGPMSSVPPYLTSRVSGVIRCSFSFAVIKASVSAEP